MLSLCPMGRIIAIDYGRKRTGLAVTDTLQMIANGLTTVPSGELTRFLADYVSCEPAPHRARTSFNQAAVCA